MSPEIEKLIHTLSLSMINEPTSYRKLAMRIGVCPFTLKRFLEGKHVPFLETVLKIEKYLLMNHKEK